MHTNRVPKKQNGEEPTESTGEVLAKDPLKSKSMIEESPISQKSES